MNTDPIQKIIRTKEEQAHILELLEKFAQSLFDIKMGPDQKINSMFPSNWQESLREYFTQRKVSLSDPIAVQKEIQMLKKELLSLPVTTIEIAIEPTEKVIQMITTWFSLSIPTHFITDIKVNKTLIGASTVTVNGKFKDYSVKKNLQQYLASQVQSEDDEQDSKHTNQDQPPQSVPATL